MSTNGVSPEITQSLEAERTKLHRQLSELGVGGTAPDYDSNFADSSQVTAERGEVAALTATLQDSLNEVENALAKIESGTYGTCEDCQNKIPGDRLEAMPTGRLCMDCASGR